MYVRKHSGHNKLLIVLLLASVTLFAVSCTAPPKKNWRIADLHVRKPVRELVTSSPAHFDKPYTLLVLVDESATCGMAEAAWWRDWEKFMLEKGYGFVLATSREDSIDLVIAAELDSVRAPTLVMPSCKRYLAESGVPRGFLPLNLLVDSSAHIHFAWSPRINAAQSQALMNTIDSLTSNPTSSGE